MGLHLKRNLQIRCLLHFFRKKRSHSFCLLFPHLYQKLIMYLKNNPGIQLSLIQLLIHSNHCQLHNVSRSSLNRGIHSDPLSKGALHKIR